MKYHRRYILAAVLLLSLPNVGARADSYNISKELADEQATQHQAIKEIARALAKEWDREGMRLETTEPDRAGIAPMYRIRPVNEAPVHDNSRALDLCPKPYRMTERDGCQSPNR